MTSPGVSISPLADWWLVLGETVMLRDAWCLFARYTGTPEVVENAALTHSAEDFTEFTKKFCCKSPVFQNLGECLQIVFDHDFDGHVTHVYTSSILPGSNILTHRWNPRWVPSFQTARSGQVNIAGSARRAAGMEPKRSM